MNTRPFHIRRGITLFKGKFPSSLLLKPIVCNNYFLEDEETVVVFDPSCGKNIAKRIEAHIRQRHQAKAEWKRAFIIAGHSHIDHANNFYLSDVIGASETHIYVHEQGFVDGKVANQPVSFVENIVRESNKYYNFYMSFSAPYNLLMYFLGALDILSPSLARKVFGIMGSLPFPSPVNGSVEPVPLKESETQVIQFGDMEVRGWKVGSMAILPTPGHTPCSVSLYWPEQKSLFISDADWIGNPVFMSSSLRDGITSLKKMEELTENGMVKLLLPGHGQVREGVDQILRHIRLRIYLLKVLRDDVLATYRSFGKEKDVRKLTKALTQESHLFSTIKRINYPRHVFFVHNIVAVCLKEEGILK